MKLPVEETFPICPGLHNLIEFIEGYDLPNLLHYPTILNLQ